MVWFLRHTGDFGFSHGALPGAIGVLAVLLIAVLVGFGLHRVERVRRIRHAPLSLAAVLFCAGAIWLAVT
ncbi:hypothetical protein [Streptomyces catenulae]|uniref:Uncharacterized protein n=1 Tax=Streptomyces catenulae TaxID=66875 RepID=A0ABV2Z5U7_9ACTN|nr:hypothetical protein [Streptomyces catenulae]